MENASVEAEKQKQRWHEVQTDTKNASADVCQNRKKYEYIQVYMKVYTRCDQ